MAQSQTRQPNALAHQPALIVNALGPPPPHMIERVKQEGLNILCVPTSLEIESYCTTLGQTITSLVNARPDWCFDGADEVDPENNLIKGRGGAFVREQLVFAAAPQ